MKRLLVKLLKPLTPANVKVWFPVVSKVGLLVVGVFTAIGRPEDAAKILDTLKLFVGDDAAFAALATAAITASVSVFKTLASDVAIASGKTVPKLLQPKPVVRDELSHQVYEECYRQAEDQGKDYRSCVVNATAAAKKFEAIFDEKRLRLQNEEGLDAGNAFFQARTFARTQVGLPGG